MFIRIFHGSMDQCVDKANAWLGTNKGVRIVSSSIPMLSCGYDAFTGIISNQLVALILVCEEAKDEKS
mgnify:CR=1 FL=1